MQNRTLLKTTLCIQAARLKLGAVVALLGLLLLELAGEVREPRAEGAHEVLLLVLQQGRGAVLDLVQRLHLERTPRCDDVQFQLRENVMTCSAARKRDDMLPEFRQIQDVFSKDIMQIR